MTQDEIMTVATAYADERVLAVLGRSTEEAVVSAYKELCAAIAEAEKQEPIHTTTTSLVSKEWRLVPVYPTKDMARAYWRFNDRTDVRMVDAWNAILEVAPASQPAVPLTEKAIVDLLPESIPAQYDGALIDFARVIEAVLKEKANDNCCTND